MASFKLKLQFCYILGLMQETSANKHFKMIKGWAMRASEQEQCFRVGKSSGHSRYCDQESSTA